MNLIEELIQPYKDSAKGHPFLKWLSEKHNPTLTAKEKLEYFVPIITVFSQMFSDFCKFGLTYTAEEARGDVLKEAINQHAKEDATHNAMLLSDIQKMGLNHTMKLTQHLTLLWTEETEEMRKVMYNWMALARKCEDPLLRYVMIETIEMTGFEIYSIITELGKEYEKVTGIKLSYFGEEHLAMEQGHPLCEVDIESILQGLEDKNWMRQEFSSVIKESFQNVSDCWDACLQYVTN